MATTVYIPAQLLKSVDRKAKAMNLSRSRFIVEALKEAVKRDTSWSPAFLEGLGQEVSKEDKDQIDDMMKKIQRARSSKKAPSL